MKTSDFSFELPPELIAQFPTDRRGDSRLMVIDPPTRNVEHTVIGRLPELAERGSVVVLNNSKVRSARLFGVTEHGGQIEFLLTERLADGEWRALVSRAGKQRVGKRYRFPDSVVGTIVRIEGSERIIRFEPEIDDPWLDRFGHIPLPPYIQRPDSELDKERYQTVYATIPGSAAAPTAGLHLTTEILDRLRARDVRIVEVTLHVGLGTFLPIRSEKVEEHTMHTEHYEVPQETANAVTDARRTGRPVVAVGTTSLRTLESAWTGRELRSGLGSTHLYVYPGYRFGVVDSLLTNFHTPESSLLLLVSAFAGADFIRDAYKEAIEKRYRFFSYGDAMLIRRRAGV